ncbi:MAG: hypothetical protein Q9181_006738 [Wetmoreana brouardii]
MLAIERPRGHPKFHADNPPVFGDPEECTALPFHATPTVEDLGAVTSGIQFEPCRFPTTASQFEDNSTDFSSINIARLQRCETETPPPFASRVQLLQTTWALLLRSYVRDDYVSFGLVDVEAYCAEFAKAVVCQFGDCIREKGDGICEISNQVVFQHVITEKQMNTAIEVNTQASDTVQVEAAQTRREVGNSALIKKDIISKEDMHIMRSWNSALPFVCSDCLHNLVQHSAILIPDTEAVCAWDGSFTYSELSASSTRIAEYMVGINIAHGTFVPFAFEKSRWTVVAMLAILKAGCAFVPLDPTHPVARLEEVIADVDANFVLTSESYASKFEHLAKKVIVVYSKTNDTFQEKRNKVHLPLVKPQDPAFVLFTSGSTGRSKGTVHEHEAICTHIMAYEEAVGYGMKRVLQFSAYTWDVAVMDIFTTLVFQGCICIPSEEDRKLRISRVINDLQVDMASLTPSFAALIDLDTVPTLQTLVLSGEAVQQENSRAETVGLLLNCLCWLVDPENHDQLVPIGAIGELVVAGPSLTRGYLNHETKNALSFFQDPPWEILQNGDLLKYNLETFDGSFDFAGRKDTQIKRHGQRVELGEIEHHISTIPNVAVLMLAAPKEGCLRGELVAVVQLHSSEPVNDSSQPISFASSQFLSLNLLKRHLSQHVPRYMIPTALLIVTNMPFTSSLKLERRRVDAWLAVVESRPSQEASIDDPESAPLESSETTANVISCKIASMLAPEDAAHRRMLEGHNFGLQQAGVNSIQIISLSIFLQKQFEVKVAMSMILSSKVTVRDLAYLIDYGNQPLSNIERSQGIDALSEAKRLGDNLLRRIAACAFNAPSPYPPTRNVFLTGATGFLGTEILRQLMALPGTIVRNLVRASTKSEAMQRIIQRASKEGWWQDGYASRIDAWPGDMVKESTLALLQMTAISRTVGSFVYVSGGQQLSPDEDNTSLMASHVQNTGGYEQSKLVAELSVKRCVNELLFERRQLRVVKPGYIIGTAETGLANRNDFIWHLVFGCLEIGSYNEDEARHWTFIADVGRVAQNVVASAFETGLDRSASVVKALDGLIIADFWNVLQQDLGYSLKPLPYVQ